MTLSKKTVLSQLFKPVKKSIKKCEHGREKNLRVDALAYNSSSKIDGIIDFLLFGN